MTRILTPLRVPPITFQLRDRPLLITTQPFQTLHGYNDITQCIAVSFQKCPIFEHSPCHDRLGSRKAGTTSSSPSFPSLECQVTNFISLSPISCALPVAERCLAWKQCDYHHRTWCTTHELDSFRLVRPRSWALIFLRHFQPQHSAEYSFKITGSSPSEPLPYSSSWHTIYYFEPHFMPISAFCQLYLELRLAWRQLDNRSQV